jgi:chromosome segregation ATPase
MATGDHEQRISSLESRVDAVEKDAKAARALIVAVDRDYSSLQTDVRGIKRMLAAHVQQTDERFTALQTEMRAGFSEVRDDITELRTSQTEMRGDIRAISTKLDRLIDQDS